LLRRRRSGVDWRIDGFAVWVRTVPRPLVALARSARDHGAAAGPSCRGRIRSDEASEFPSSPYVRVKRIDRSLSLQSRNLPFLRSRLTAAWQFSMIDAIFGAADLRGIARRTAAQGQLPVLAECRRRARQRKRTRRRCGGQHLRRSRSAAGVAPPSFYLFE
jgi:hypothetical protein